jgi:hypothetical protein
VYPIEMLPGVVGRLPGVWWWWVMALFRCGARR